MAKQMAAAPFSGSPRPPPQGPDGQRERERTCPILVVERDPHIRELEAHFLGEAGYSVEFASDGRDALEQAKKLLPELVITEILVPKLDGLALCRALKGDRLTKGISVLVFSMLAASARAAEAGADAYLMKPLSDQRLVDTVRALLAKRRQLSADASGDGARAVETPSLRERL